MSDTSPASFDRYASFKTNWQKFYNAGEIILADRYVTSNMVHQAVKINDDLARDKFLDSQAQSNFFCRDD